MRRRALAWGGIAGPLAFVGAWATGGLVTERDYSPVTDTISRLAGVGADTRVLMSAGMVGFGLAVPAYAMALRAALPGPAWVAASITGVSTLFVAALPVDHSRLLDGLHAVAAGLGYVSLALTPLLAAGPLRRLGRGRLATAGLVLGTISSLALPVSLAVDQTGLFQRVGLTAGDVWLAASVPTIRALLTDPPTS